MIDKPAVYDSLINMFKAIIKVDKNIDKLLSLVFLNHLEQEYNKGNINDLAYNLLKEDVNWLLNR